MPTAYCDFPKVLSGCGRALLIAAGCTAAVLIAACCTALLAARRVSARSRACSVAPTSELRSSSVRAAKRNDEVQHAVAYCPLPRSQFQAVCQGPQHRQLLLHDHRCLWRNANAAGSASVGADKNCQRRLRDRTARQTKLRDNVRACATYRPAASSDQCG